ncbi:MAG: flagellin [Bacteroidota bacterium]
MTSFRIARERSLYQSFNPGSMHAQQRQLAQLREQVSTGMRVNRPSDDPAAFGKARSVESLNERYGAHLRTIESSRSWLNHTEQALDHMVELYTQASEEMLRASGDSRWTGDRVAIAGRLESILDEVIDTMNVQVDGEYLFAGTRTRLAPFDADGNLTAPDPADIDGARMRDIGPSTEIQINVSGRALFEVSDTLTIVDALAQSIEAVRFDDGAGDYDGMQQGLANIEAARNHLTDLVASTGNTARRLSLAESNLRDMSLLAEARRSELEDMDMLDGMMQLQRAETGLQAALQVAGRTLQTSILDYLR